MSVITHKSQSAGHGECQRCGKPDQELVWGCTQQWENGCTLSMVCTECSDQLGGKQAVREEDVERVASSLLGSEERARSRRIRHTLLHGRQ